MTRLIPVFLAVGGIAAAQLYPDAEWPRRKPSEVGIDERALEKLLPRVGIGGVIIRHGYLVASWGHPEIAVQTASMGKSFTSTVLGLPRSSTAKPLAAGGPATPRTGPSKTAPSPPKSPPNTPAR